MRFVNSGIRSFTNVLFKYVLTSATSCWVRALRSISVIVVIFFSNTDGEKAVKTKINNIRSSARATSCCNESSKCWAANRHGICWRIVVAKIGIFVAPSLQILFVVFPLRIDTYCSARSWSNPTNLVGD